RQTVFLLDFSFFFSEIESGAYPHPLRGRGGEVGENPPASSIPALFFEHGTQVSGPRRQARDSRSCDLAVAALGLLDDSVGFLARHLYRDGVLLHNAVGIAL